MGQLSTGVDNAIEAGIRGRAAEQRLAIRQAQSAPLVAELEAWLHTQLNRLSRGSRLAEAILNGVDPQAWLTDVLEQMVSGKVSSRSLASLLPLAWRDARVRIRTAYSRQRECER